MAIHPNDLIVRHLPLEDRHGYQIQVFCLECSNHPILLQFVIPADIVFEFFPDEDAFKAEVIRFTITIYSNHLHT